MGANAACTARISLSSGRKKNDLKLFHFFFFFFFVQWQTIGLNVYALMAAYFAAVSGSWPSLENTQLNAETWHSAALLGFPFFQQRRLPQECRTASQLSLTQDSPDSGSLKLLCYAGMKPNAQLRTNISRPWQSQLSLVISRLEVNNSTRLIYGVRAVKSPNSARTHLCFTLR